MKRLPFKVSFTQKRGNLGRDRALLKKLEKGDQIRGLVLEGEKIRGLILSTKDLSPDQLSTHRLEMNFDFS